MASLTDTLIRLIDESPLSLHQIAKQAQVPYLPLQRFVRGRRGQTEGRVNDTYSVESADAIYQSLTGKHFVEGGEA
jgi:predicted transcriptional regulator